MGGRVILSGGVSVVDERTVLVVDDDPAIVELMRDFLEAEGFRVEGAVSAQAAQTVLDRTAVDCLLLDIMMPGESGFDLCRRVRRTSDVPILFLSARGEDLDKIRGLGLGGDDYIVKSATPPEVVARVKAVLRRYGGPETIRDATLDFGRLALDARAREVRIDGEPISLYAAGVRNPLPARRAPAPGIHLRATAGPLLERRR